MWKALRREPFFLGSVASGTAFPGRWSGSCSGALTRRCRCEPCPWKRGAEPLRTTIANTCRAPEPHQDLHSLTLETGSDSSTALQKAFSFFPSRHTKNYFSNARCATGKCSNVLGARQRRTVLVITRIARYCQTSLGDHGPASHWRCRCFGRKDCGTLTLASCGPRPPEWCSPPP